MVISQQGSSFDSKPPFLMPRERTHSHRYPRNPPTYDYASTKCYEYSNPLSAAHLDVAVADAELGAGQTGGHVGVHLGGRKGRGCMYLFIFHLQVI